jgi:hypothetical protein
MSVFTTFNPTTISECIQGKTDGHLPSLKSLFEPPEIQGMSDEEVKRNRDENMDFYYINYKKVFDVITNTYGVITIPKNTLIFHSNQYFNKFIIPLEPHGSAMKIQDIRTYKNKKETIIGTLPLSEVSARVYANFTPAANFHVVANINASEHIYMTTEDIHFLQLPYVNGYGHLKDVFNLTSTSFLKKYLQDRRNLGNKECGFILSTSVDRAGILDNSATYFMSGSDYVYPEILILDGFNKFKKCGQYDILNLNDNGLPTLLDNYSKNRDPLEYLRYFLTKVNVNTKDHPEHIPIEPRIKRVDFNKLLESIKNTFGINDGAVCTGRYEKKQLKIYLASELNAVLDYNVFSEFSENDPW